MEINRKIWVVGTGVLFNHSEFMLNGVSRVTTRQNFVSGDPPADGDCNGHGTHYASGAAGQYRGLATQAEIGSVRVMDCQGSGTLANVIAGFQFVAANQTPNKTNIMLASFGSAKSVSVDDALNQTVDAGVVAVVPSGGGGTNACSYSPAGASEAITVAAATKDDTMSIRSNYGPCITIFAPGESIHAAYIPSNTSYATYSGLGVPLTGGAIALFATTQSQPVNTSIVKNALVTYGTKNAIRGTLPAGTPNLLINANWGKI